MTALDCLADQARWTAWRNELGPTGKPTKIPHTPWRERAKIDNPASWVTLREAEACARQIIDGSFNDFRNNTSSLIIGSRLAELLDVTPGDTMQLLSPGGEYWRFTVAAIARSGVGSIDSVRVYSHDPAQ